MSKPPDRQTHRQIWRHGVDLRRTFLARTALIAPLAGAALCALGGTAARAQSSNMYSSYTDTVTLSSFLQPLQRPTVAGGGNAPALNVTFNPGTPNQATSVKVTMDTGSTGMVISSNHINTTGLTSLGPGAGIYTSDGLKYTGTYYNVPFTVSGTDNKVNAGGTVKVLVVPQSQGDFQMMGIGYDRGGNQGAIPVFPGVDQNAFLNISQINGTPVTNMRTGYVITKDGVTLGLTLQQGAGYAMVKLTPNTIYPPNVWNRPPVAVTIGGTPRGVGDTVPDTGIPYMLVTLPQPNIPGTQACSNSNLQGTCLSNGVPVQVSLTPGIPGGLSYSFNVGSPSVPMTPEFVNIRGVDANNVLNIATPVFVNTGVGFYQGFNYLFDFVGGYVGYAPITTSGISGFMPLLALQSDVPLPNGFTSSLPTFLLAPTTLQTGGAVAFNAPITGLDNGLTLTGGGAFAFNGPVGLGAGAFSLQQGAASINAGLSAASVTVGAQGALNNSAGSTIVANVFNAGAINNSAGGTMVGAVANVGAFNNNGLVSGSVSNQGILGGTGTIVGNVSNFGVIAPGNSIGTMTIAGTYTQASGSSYQAEVNGTGQSDHINVVGPATLQGGTVSVTAVPGSVFGPRTTYTLLNATAGVSGTYASVNELYPFLLSSLSYDPNNVYLTLQPGGFAAAAQTRTQYVVGTALDAGVANASGDFATIIGTLATLQAGQVLPFMTSISGQNYSAFSSSMVQGAQLFMNNFANQTGGGGSPVSNRVALAESCEVACDGSLPPQWGAWGGALGGLGTIGVGAATGAVTYNVGGFAAGLDRLVVPSFRAGVTVGYTTGTQWTSGFSGNGTTDTFLAGLYGNYREGKAYADAVAGYAYSYNQMWRQISIPTLQQRLAQGRTGSNQWYGQVETGYRFDLGTAGPAVADTFVTPFARLQGYTGTQNGFTETAAQSLNLTVAQQTTNSLRSVIGAQLGGAIDLGWREKVALQFRLGWGHEYANTARPVTAALGGAPLSPFTTYGIAPQRDSAVVGFAANTAVAEATSFYLRYEGNLSGQDSTHALTAGVRMTW